MKKAPVFRRGLFVDYLQPMANSKWLVIRTDSRD